MTPVAPLAVPAGIDANPRVATIGLQMRITQTGLRSGIPVTQFATTSTSRRESHLGLRRRLAPQITSHPAQYARVPLVDALRAAARGVNGIGGSRPDENADRPRRSVIVRRSDSVTWSRPANGHGHRPRSRSAAPWRG